MAFWGPGALLPRSVRRRLPHTPLAHARGVPSPGTPADSVMLAMGSAMFEARRLGRGAGRHASGVSATDTQTLAAGTEPALQPHLLMYGLRPTTGQPF